MGSKPTIRVRPRSARALILGAAGTLVLALAVAITAPSSTGCTTHQCDTLFRDYYGGQMVGPDTYETSDQSQDWIDYPGLETLHVHFPVGTARAPISIDGYVGNGLSPNGGPDNQIGNEWTAASGLLAQYGAADSTGFYVTNGSCAQYYARFVVTFAPAAVSLFGGIGAGLPRSVAWPSHGGTAAVDDSWTWTQESWTPQAPTPEGPPARALATFVSLPTTKFLFGGTIDGTGDDPKAYLLDTWTWNGASWSPIFFPDFPSSYPAARADAAAGAIDGQLVMFGGHGVDGSGVIADLGDTWTWDERVGDPWTYASPLNGGPSPVPRSGAAATAWNGNLLLFGGCSEETAAGCSSDALLSDTWLWNGTAWTELPVPGPSPRFHAAATTLGSTVLLFGGDNGNGDDLADTWQWDGTAWMLLNIPGPSARSEAAIGTLDGTAVLFGGSSPNGTLLGDTWTFAAGTWTEQFTPGPSPRAGAAAAGP